MANDKIVALKKVTEDWGGTDWTLLLLYDISADPVVDSASNQIVPQSAGNLPSEALPHLDADVAPAIQAGDMIFQQVKFTRTAGEGQADFIARVRAEFVARKAWYLARFQDQYEQVGLSVDPAP